MLIDPNARYQTNYDLCLGNGKKEVYILSVDVKRVYYTSVKKRYDTFKKTGNLPKKMLKKTHADFLELYEKIEK